MYEKNWTLMVNERLRLFETNVAAATVADRQILMNEEKQWSYGGALFYSMAVITTIGFGNWTPKTTAGKLMTMVYAVMGIPLMIICLSYLGTLLAHALRFAYTAVCCFFFSCCFPRKEYAYKSQSALTSVSLEEADFTVDLEEPIEEISAEEHLIGNSENPHQIQILTNSYMLPTMDVNAVDVDPNTQMPLSNVAAEHELNYKAVEKDVSPTFDVNVEIQNISDEHGDGYSANRNLCEEIVTKESFNFLEEEGNTQEDNEECKGSNTKEPVTPSRIPLIGRSQAYEYPLSALAEAKNIWTSALSTRPPTPVPNKRRGGRYKVPIFLVLGILCAYICIGGVAFAAMEGKSFLDGAYFCFVTLATIGFGETHLGKSQESYKNVTTFQDKAGMISDRKG
ncbi:hypothetical protein J437_LFUL001146 [Ladona fulva]|uniref:Potassium channel domain-containing protein n=1 Tax=Ladona fulva TaxID=123851 RepID=A0A8K0JXR6_LADFU|nr:hypothetical protein J437_LFUL001146 [Ladona fulva]